ncbi:S8 family serine peptidase [Chitinophaga solisilvae]|uniref:S8 family serine peptidase n=1 Tax=Chitinophaga solisilvae TaxID=1233460 RepID=UPI0013683CF7|nr:S8 family serine peptidase [Chitinophaga solisilvae]
MENDYIILQAITPSGVKRDAGNKDVAEIKAGPQPVEYKAITTSLSDKAAADTARDPSTLAMSPSMPLQLITPFESSTAAAPASGGVTWNIQSIGADASDFTGENTRIAILDTGIDADHEAFKGVSIVTKNFTDDKEEGDVCGHGTHCAGVIFGRDVAGTRIGIARGVTKALIGKVISPRSTSGALTKGINWAVENGAHIISISLGLDFPAFVQQLEERDMPRNAAISMALEAYRKNLQLFQTQHKYLMANVESNYIQPVILIAATGNESSRPRYTVAVAPPAAAEGILTVGAVKQENDRLIIAPFSNTGATYLAPGVNILSAKAGGGLISKDGTSMAAPHVAGVAALWAGRMISGGKLTRELLIDRLKQEADGNYGLEAPLIKAPAPLKP